MAKKKARVFLKNCDNYAQSYCFNKGFIIYPEMSTGGYKIWYEIYGKGKFYDNGVIFSESEVYQAIWDLYSKILEYDENRKC